MGRNVKRGEIWSAACGKDYAGKPRPVVILQDDRFDMTDSVTVFAFTTDPTDAPLLAAYRTKRWQWPARSLPIDGG